jgi:hypothetical protein
LGEEEINKWKGEDPLFVSLGSYCGTAHTHRALGIRKAAFPLDWICSFDGEKVIELMEEDFLHFLNPDFFSEGPSGALLNTNYRLEFLNEGDWSVTSHFEENIKIFLPKCQRRIDRFRKLGDYQGKVFFVRTAYVYSMTDPNRVWKVKENLEITREYSERLYNTLKKRFPHLDFGLIIFNDHDCLKFELEGDFSDSLLMCKVHFSDDASYKAFYTQLLLQKSGIHL